MAKTIIRAHMKQRRDTAVNWQAQNPILLDGEIGIVTDQPDRYKVGDGVTEWNALPLRGFDGNIVQMTGGSRTAVMSQWAVTHALEEMENNMLTLDKLEEATKDLASKAELSGAIETLTAEMLTNEEVTAAALNDLNSKAKTLAKELNELSESISTELESIKVAINALAESSASKEYVNSAISSAILTTLNTAI